MPRRLSGHLAFVTLGDGAGGDGRQASLARALHREGALVVVVSPDAEAGGRLADALGAQAVFCPGDDVEADVHALVELADDLLQGARPGLGPRQA